jgi:5,10-methylenetetrahydromethanopterin reductase
MDGTPRDMPRLGIRLHGGLTPQRCVELAVTAEAQGFASAWFAENPLERGTLPALAACATATRRIGLGIGVWNPFLRHPAQIAMDASALDELAEGRLTLGIGSGLAALIGRLGAGNTKTLAALKDTFAIVRGLLAGETVTYKGKVFAVEDAKLSYKPRRPDLPILMAARGPKALALAADIADGLMISNMCPPGFAAWAASIARPARLVQYAPCVVADDRATALAAIKPVLAGLLKTFWTLGRQVPAAKASLIGHSGIAEADFAAAVAGSAMALDERFVDAFAVAGTVEDCRARIAAYGAAGVTDLVLTFVSPDPVRDMARLSLGAMA